MDMEENRQEVQREPRRKTRRRVIAGVVTAALVLSIGANAAVGIRIDAGNRKEAATNYLVDHTAYVQEDRAERLRQKAETLSQPETLEDFYRLAGTQIAEEAYEEALESIETCLELYPGGDPALYVDLLMKKGCLQVLLARQEEALETLDLALKEKPELTDAYLVKAQIYAESGQAAPLAETLHAYLELEPEDDEIRTVLAQALTTESDYQGAAEQYQQVLDHAEEDQDVTETAFLHALTNIQLGRFDQAEKSLKLVRKQAPQTEGLSYYMGVCQMSRGDYTGAISSMTAAIEENSMLQLSTYSRGVCRLMTDDMSVEAAEADLRKAAAYTGADADQAIAAQARNLLDEVDRARQEAERLAAEELERQEAARAAEAAAAAAAQAEAAPDTAETPADAAPAETGEAASETGPEEPADQETVSHVDPPDGENAEMPESAEPTTDPAPVDSVAEDSAVPEP